MKKYLIVFACFLAGCSASKVDIKPLSPYETKETGNVTNVKNDSILFKFFVVDGFNHRDRKKIEQVEIFAQSHMDKGYDNYKQYEMMFYRKTNVLNESFKDDEDHSLANHQPELVMHFLWSNGKFGKYLLLDNGNCLNCEGKVEEVK